MGRTGLCVLGVVALTLSLPVWARDDMSGLWVEDYDETIISVEQWGPHCGEAPKSIGRRNRNLSYVVKDRGVDLYFKAVKKGRSFSTSACQSTNKKIKPKERNLKDKLFLVNCATSESAQSYESGLYSFRIKSIAKIEYRETSRFSRNIKGALCVHTRRVRRIYTHQIGKEVPKVAEPPKKEPEPVVGTKIGSDRDDPCRAPGPPVRLKLKPARASLLPGGKVCPKAAAFDARGCKTETNLSWGKGVPPQGIKLDIHGCLKAAANVKPGPKKVNLAAGSAQAAITLVVKKRVARKTGPETPEPPKEQEPPPPEEKPAEAQDAGPADAGPREVAAATAPKVDAGTAAQEPEPPAEAEPATAGPLPGWVLPVSIGGGVILLALVLFLVLRKPGRATGRAPVVPPLTGPVQMAAPISDSQAPAPLAPASGAQKEAPPPAVPAGASPPTMPDPRPVTSTDQVARAFCTTCGKAIPGDAKFCPYDRTPIYRPGSPTLASAPVCPTCKRLLPMGAKFCPYDRTKLT